MRRSRLRKLISSVAAAGLVALGLPFAVHAAVAQHTHSSVRSGSARVPSVAAFGVVTGIEKDQLDFLTATGSHIATSIPGGDVNYFTKNHVIRLCETVVLEYQKISSGARLDELVPVGIDTSSLVSLGRRGNCAADSDGEIDRVGSITALSSAAVTLQLLGGPATTFRLAPGRDLQADEGIGDLADVTYSASNGLAYNLESSELYTEGTITAVSNHSMTITEASTGKSVKLPPDAAAYINLHRGNLVGVDYVIVGGKPKADNIVDLTTGANN